MNLPPPGKKLKNAVLIISAAALLYFLFPALRASMILLGLVVLLLAVLIYILVHVERYVSERRTFSSWAEKRIAKQAKPDGNPPEIRCTSCGAPMVLRTGTRGKFKGKKFYGCSNYPSCRTIIPSGIVQEQPETAEAQREAPACRECGAKMVLRKAGRGRNKGQSFYGCSNFPKCRYTEKA
jgi:ssDNA-binding Zn-finger/Zn-ribbon topoisomerase 1